MTHDYDYDLLGFYGYRHEKSEIDVFLSPWVIVMDGDGGCRSLIVAFNSGNMKNYANKLFVLFMPYAAFARTLLHIQLEERTQLKTGREWDM